MPVSLGIDFGMEFCRLATADNDGSIRLMASQQVQQRKTPCAVGFSDRWLWGWSALDAPDRLVWDLKALVCEESVYGVKGRSYDGAELIHQFFRLLRLGLVEVLGDATAGPAALTVPYSFGIRQRELLREAAENAGFSVAGLINDAEAALLGCKIENLLPDGDVVLVVVFDVGATSTDVSVLEVKRSDGWLRADLLMHDDQAPGFRSVQRRVLQEAGWELLDDVPEGLQCQPFETALSQAAARGGDAVFEVEGKLVEIRADSIVTAIAEWRIIADEGLSRALDAANLQPRDIDLAVPAGGGCEIPEVRNTIAHFAKVLEPSGGADIESICARGAARYAAMLASDESERFFQSAEVPAIGFELADGSFHPVLGINHSQHAHDFRVYAPTDTGSDVLELRLREGFARMAVGNWLLSEEPIEIRLTAADTLIKAGVAREDTRQVGVTVLYGDEAHGMQFDLI